MCTETSVLFTHLLHLMLIIVSSVAVVSVVFIATFIAIKFIENILERFM